MLALTPLWQKLGREQQPRLAQKQLCLRTLVDGEARDAAHIHLHADPFWLEQALANLLDNAIREAQERSIYEIAWGLLF